MIKKIKTKLKASALVVTMIILGIILVSTLSISLVAVQERKSSIGENKSNQAYQTADTGIEKVMQAIIKGGYSTANQITIAGVTCDANGLLAASDNSFKVELKAADEMQIRCDAAASIASIKSLKSVGSAGGNQRAVEVAVAQTCGTNPHEVVASNDTRTMSASQAADVRAFIASNSNLITGFKCDDGSNRYFCNSIKGVTFNTGTVDFKLYCTNSVFSLFDLDYLDCYGSSPICNYKGSACNEGWVIYGICAE